jgi:AbrB family looped-hinge helix DNA binding protein
MPYGIVNAMKSAIPIDSAGRLVLPKQVRRQFHLIAGDRLELEVVPDGILLRASSRQAALVEENGLLVHEGEAVGDLVQAVELARSGRDAEVLGLRR